MARRQGFTITELLVAFALIMFIMVILTEAFTAGLESFRRLKALGDMQTRLRAAGNIMRRDLQAEHFETLFGNRLSDQDLRTMAPPDAGFFRIWQRYANQSGPTVTAFNQCSTREVGSWAYEGIDLNGLSSTISTDHVLAFTVRLRGSLPSDFFYTPLVGLSAQESNLQQGPADVQQIGNINSQWVEVIYFLRPKAGRTAYDSQTNNPTQLYTLYRKQRLLGHPGNRPELPPSASYHAISLSAEPGATAGTFLVNDPRSITRPSNRFGPWTGNSPPAQPKQVIAGLYDNSPPPSSGPNPLVFSGWPLEESLGLANPQAGDDLVVTDVVAFDIKVAYDDPATPSTSLLFRDLPYASSKNVILSGAGYAVFDTWSRDTPSYATEAGPEYKIPTKIRVYALQITIRVWDEKTEQSRQVTIIQDM